MNERWIVVINLSVVSVFVISGRNVILPILPQYAVTFNIPVALTEWGISSYTIAAFFAEKRPRA